MKKAIQILSCLAIGCVFASGAMADSVKLSGTWIDGVTIQQISGGKLTYTTDIGGEITKPLAQIQGIKSTFYPDLTTGQDALEAGDSRKALAAYSKAAASARDPWARHYALWQKLLLQDKDGTPVEALLTYLQLVKDKAEAHYTSMPPLNALKRAKPEQVADLMERVEKAQSASGDVAQEQFKMMLDVLQIQAPTASPATPAASAAPAATAPGGAPMPAAAPAAPPKLRTTARSDESSAVALPASLERDDAITAMLMGGRFQEAIDTASDRLSKKEPKIAMRLYQMGVAQLNLGLANNNEKLLKDAGLSFMRVIVYFSKSSYKGPALLEVGLVHEKIGQHDKAVELWRKARVEIDPEEDPTLTKRLNDLMGLDGEEPAAEPAAAEPATPAS